MYANEAIQRLDKLIEDFDHAKGNKRVRDVIKRHAFTLTQVADALEADLRKVGEFAGVDNEQ